MYSVVFQMHWDVEGFLSEELEGQRNLAPVFTLSGTMKKAFSATCEDHIRHFWSDFGLCVLERLFPGSHNLNHTVAHSKFSLQY